MNKDDQELLEQIEGLSRQLAEVYASAVLNETCTHETSILLFHCSGELAMARRTYLEDVAERASNK